MAKGKPKTAREPKANRAEAKPEAAPLRLEWRSPAELADNPANWRRHPESQVAALSDVIAEVGWAGACLFNERTGRLIDGHARKSVAVLQGAKSVPVLVGNWTEEQERKILATLDPLAGMAEVDPAALAALLSEVETESESVKAMLAKLSESNPEAIAAGAGGDEFDVTPEDSGPTRTAAGELWLIGGKHRLLVGDCTAKENVEKLMGGKKAAVMVTDPPYAVEYVGKARDMSARGYGHSRAKSRAAIKGDGLDEDSARELWRAAFTVAFESAVWPNAALYIWHAPGRAMLTLYNLLAEMDVLHHQTIIWLKNNFVIGRCDYQWIHEPCFYGWQKGNRPAFNGPKNQTTVWQFPRDTNAPEHPTQKPLAIMSPPFENHTAAGEIGYDPFLGSGTTLVAAHRLGRVCFGCELEPRYADVILKRAEAEGLSVGKAE